MIDVVGGEQKMVSQRFVVFVVLIAAVSVVPQMLTGQTSWLRSPDYLLPESGLVEPSLLYNSSGLQSGVYFYRLQTGNFISIKRMMILR